jgi:L-alanine-DL-glutamate epimerase-like enolase superfamily enzyme
MSPTRRHFLAALSTLPAFAQSKPLEITAVEIWQLHGHRDTTRGVDQQYQANPLYIYDELRPKPYSDGRPSSQNAPLSAYYLKIKTDGGPDGLYGPIDKEVAIVVDEQLRPFLLKKDALAQESSGPAHRSNRHARRGFFLMAISAVDHALWDLRDVLQDSVYRLLGAHSQQSIGLASCLGYSRTRSADARRSPEARRLSLSEVVPRLRPRRPEGLRKNVDLVRLLREAVGEDTELMFDVYSGWDLSYALDWAKRVERYRPRWIEEATQAEKIDSFAQLRKGTSIPIASGEHIQGRWEVYDYLKAGALSVVQCDPEWCGGT